MWAFGSLLGGLVYGALRHGASAFWLLGGLALTTGPVALASDVSGFAVLSAVCGILCAPTLIATVDAVGRLVPEESRGEAIGWHASALTLGQSVGAPLAGLAIDHAGWRWEFLGVATGAAVVSVAGSLVGAGRRARARHLCDVQAQTACLSPTAAVSRGGLIDSAATARADKLPA